MKDILSTITKHRNDLNWTEYQLAERAGLPQSTISSWYRKNLQPSVASLDKICNAFGITLAQLFSEDETTVCLTREQNELLCHWAKLRDEERKVLLALMQIM